MTGSDCCRTHFGLATIWGTAEGASRVQSTEITRANWDARPGRHQMGFAAKLRDGVSRLTAVGMQQRRHQCPIRALQRWSGVILGQDMIMWMLTVRFQISNRTPRLPGVHSCGLTCGGAADRQTVETIGRLGGGGFSEIATPNRSAISRALPASRLDMGRRLRSSLPRRTSLFRRFSGNFRARKDMASRNDISTAFLAPKWLVVTNSST